MKKVLLTLFLLILFLTACGRPQNSSAEQNMAEMLKPPVLVSLPLQGIWDIKEIREPQETPSSPARYAVGGKLYVDASFVALGDSITVQPKYSSKLVKLTDYLAGRLDPSFFNLKEDASVQVMMIRDNDFFSLDLIRLDENHVAFLMDSRLYLLERTNEVIPETTKQEFIRFAATTAQNEFGTASDSHIFTLIGVRSTARNSSGYNYPVYQTYFIADEPEQARPLVYKSDHLFLLNESNEAWLLDYVPESVDETNRLMRGRFSYYPLADPDSNQRQILHDLLGRNITFASGNTVAFEKPGAYPVDATTPKKYEIHRLDQLEDDISLTVTDLGGVTESNAFRDQIDAQLSFIDPNGEVDRAAFPIDETNIGIQRKNTAWGFVTSMNWSVGNKSFPSRINIDLVPSWKMFDTPVEALSWTRISNKVPQATTASMSTGMDRVLIRSEDEVQYFRSSRSSIEENALLSLQLGPDTQIINIQFFYDEQGSQLKETFLKQKLSQPQVIYSDRADRDRL